MRRLPEKPIEWMKYFEEEKDATFKTFENPVLFKKIEEFNKRYLYWDELRYRVENKDVQKQLWALMKLNRSYEKIPYKPLKIKYALIPEIFRYLHKFDKFLAGNLETNEKTLHLEKRYIVSSLMEEAIASSMIEGAVTTRKVAKEMLKQKRKPKDKNEQMVVNGYETIQYIVKNKNKKLTPDFLIEIQEMITRQTLTDESDVGKFRDNNKIIVGDDYNPEIVYHVPPDFKEIPKYIKELCKFANNDDKHFIHPVIKGIVLHFLIGYIHPFNDGNGRTARSIFYWYVLSKGYWLFEYMAVSRRILRSKKKYGLSYLYSEYDEFDLTYFIKYNVEAINESLHDLLEFIKLKQEEQNKAEKLVENIKELNFRQANILENIIKNPNKFFSIQEIAETFDVVYQTARTDLLRLNDLGYVTMKKISKKFLFKFNPNSNI